MMYWLCKIWENDHVVVKYVPNSSGGGGEQKWINQYLHHRHASAKLSLLPHENEAQQQSKKLSLSHRFPSWSASKAV